MPFLANVPETTTVDTVINNVVSGGPARIESSSEDALISRWRNCYFEVNSKPLATAKKVHNGSLSQLVKKENCLTFRPRRDFLIKWSILDLLVAGGWGVASKIQFFCNREG